MSFPDRIHAIRKDMKLSQEKFGELAGVSQRTVAFWESGERTPSYATISRLADTLGVSVDYMLGRSDSKTDTKTKKPAADGDELNSQLVSLLLDLPENQTQRVLDFVAGLKAAREE